MRSIRALVITFGFAAAFLAVGPAKADVTVGVNNPSNGNCYPFLCNDSGQSSGPSIEYQQVYNSSAFPGTITVNGLTFYENTVFGGTGKVLGGTYAFSWGYTSLAAGSLGSLLASNFDLGPASGLGAVVIAPGAVSANPSFSFDVTPFTYNPALGNLLLEVDVTDQELIPNYSGNSYNEIDQSGATSRAYSFDGNASGVADATGLVTTFSETPEPSYFALLGGGISALIASRRLRKFFGRRTPDAGDAA
jgi:hypothetical protein